MVSTTLSSLKAMPLEQLALREWQAEQALGEKGKEWEGRSEELPIAQGSVQWSTGGHILLITPATWNYVFFFLWPHGKKSTHPYKVNKIL